MNGAINPETFPLLLRDAQQWATHRAKVPYISGTARKAKSTDPTTWGTFDDARAAVEAGKADGLYYALKTGSGIVGVDLDHCVENGVIAPWALVYVRLLNSYTCLSTSLTGLRIFVKATKPTTDCKRGPIEFYDHDRLLSMTDQRVPGTPDTVEERQAELEAFHKLAFPPKPKPERKAAPAPKSASTIILTDDERFAAAMRHDKFKRLHEGNTSDYPSDSETRIAYLNLAAWYSGKSPAAMERWIRASSLNSAKFDDSRGDTTFLQTEIDDAIGYVDGEYTPGASWNLEPTTDTPSAPQSGSDGAQACRGCIERDKVIAVQRERIAKLMAENNGGRFSNLIDFRKTANLSGKKKDVVEALAFEIDSARKAGRNEVTLYYGDREARKEGRDPGGIAGVAGTSPATVGTVVSEIRTRKESPWTFQTVTDRENGTQRVVARFDPKADISSDLAAVAAIPRAAAQHGGYRPGCPDHPQADLIIRRQTVCADCGQVVSEAQSRVCGDPLLQVATRSPAAERGSYVSRMSPDSTRSLESTPFSPDRSATDPDPLQHDATRPLDPMAEALERIRQRHRGDVPPDDPTADVEQEAVSEAFAWRPEVGPDEEAPPEPFDLWEELATAGPAPVSDPVPPPRRDHCRECGTAEAGPGGLYCPPCMEAYYEANPWARAATQAGAA